METQSVGGRRGWFRFGNGARMRKPNGRVLPPGSPAIDRPDRATAGWEPAAGLLARTGEKGQDFSVGVAGRFALSATAGLFCGWVPRLLGVAGLVGAIGGARWPSRLYEAHRPRSLSEYPGHSVVWPGCRDNPATHANPVPDAGSWPPGPAAACTRDAGAQRGQPRHPRAVFAVRSP
jgi:hypothetical protein